MKKNYDDFLKSKVMVAEKFGMDTSKIVFSEKLFPHQRDIVNFCLEGGRRAIFASFGLGKTFMQLEIAKQLIIKTGKPFLIVCPLGVSGEFKRDNEKLGTGYAIDYIKHTDNIINPQPQIYLSNYERIRKGDIDPSYFCGVSFDEASIIRNRSTDTTDYVMQHFAKVPFRFVATATPTPNKFIEISNYAVYLGVATRGEILTKYFKRNAVKAGDLTLYEHKKQEFWAWVSTWAAFLSSPSDLGYDSTGYDLPKLNIIEHCITFERDEQPVDKYGEPVLIPNLSKSLKEVSTEKRVSMMARIDKAIEISETIEGNMILWHHRNREQVLLERRLKGKSYVSVYGGQDTDVKEKNIISFSEGNYKYLLTKPEIAGSGCNFQYAGNNMVFVGINYDFNDTIQSVYRMYRFGQTKEVNVHFIYTNAESHVFQVLKEKWRKHEELQKEMIALVKEYGLNSDLVKSQMERQLFMKNKTVTYKDGDVILYNDDCVKAWDKIKPKSLGMILTSIPFGNHYEYSDNYNDFGHNETNGKFFNQMDYLIPKLWNSLDDGRVACIHVKDRIQYSHQNDTTFSTISDFSGQTIRAFEKTHIKERIEQIETMLKSGIIKKEFVKDLEKELEECKKSYDERFYLMGRITVTTDVVAENNQTYRLGWTEKCKDGSKMSVGIPEYVLLFRKEPSHRNNAYADVPVVHSKLEYLKAQWQLDAHAYWRSSGNRFMSKDEMMETSVKSIVAAWKKYNTKSLYDFQEHFRICKELDEMEKLSSTFMTIPVHSNGAEVWTDVSRMRTLNANQVSKKKEKHICPLQFDIVERLIELFTNKGEIVGDPFGGLMTTPYIAIKKKRKAVASELNTEYFLDGCFYVKTQIENVEAPTLFDILDEEIK